MLMEIRNILFVTLFLCLYYGCKEKEHTITIENESISFYNPFEKEIEDWEYMVIKSDLNFIEKLKGVYLVHDRMELDTISKEGVYILFLDEEGEVKNLRTNMIHFCPSIEIPLPPLPPHEESPTKVDMSKNSDCFCPIEFEKDIPFTQVAEGIYLSSMVNIFAVNKEISESIIEFKGVESIQLLFMYKGERYFSNKIKFQKTD